MACATSRSVRSVARAWTSPTSSRRSPKKSSSSSSSRSGLLAERWTGFRRGRSEYGVEKAEELRLKVGGLEGFFTLLECARLILKPILFGAAEFDDVLKGKRLTEFWTEVWKCNARSE